MLPLRHGDSVKKIGYVRWIWEKAAGWFRLIMSDPNSRNLLGFLLLNLSFAFVELIYGVITNSLGLISDSFHMFFDCTGLLAGLVASVITKWKSNEKYSYGYVRAEVLAGFINGLFLIFISFFIFSEAVERLVEPPEVKHERLLPVSIAGFLVNIVGIVVFQHGGAGHGHSHDGGHGHSHGGHGHSHGGSNEQIFKGVYLHILADTLGSVGVIISALLMQYFGWMIADPICSMIIAILIFISVGSLLKESTAILMQRQPIELDNKLPECFNKVTQIQGVHGVHATHFWTLCSNSYVGGLKLEVSHDADPKYVISHTQMIFRDIAGVKELFIQLDYERQQNTYQNLIQFPNNNGVASSYNNINNQQFQNHNHQGGHGHSHGGHGHDHGHGHSHAHQNQYHVGDNNHYHHS